MQWLSLGRHLICSLPYLQDCSPLLLDLQFLVVHMDTHTHMYAHIRSRPATSFLWFTSPWRTFRYIIWRHNKWRIIGVIVFILLVVIIIIFICTLPVSHTTDLSSDKHVTCHVTCVWPAFMYHVICHVTNTAVVVSLEALVEICDYHSYSELRIH